jgi:peptide/nickel transport system ATP-binding protein
MTESNSRTSRTALVDIEPGAPVLQVDDLRTWFPTPRGVVHAVDGVSLTLRQGETLGIVGESGSGKSVLSRTIMRLLPDTAVTSGTVRFGDLNLSAMSAGAVRSVWGDEIAMVFQNPMTSLNPVMRVGRQVSEVLKRHRDMNRRAARARAVELFRMVGIPEPERRLRNYPHEMSGGMRQRVCIAIAIACTPRLLLADEPTTALDVTIQRQILDVMDKLRADSNMSMILVTHDLGVVAGRADRVLVMYGGRVVETGDTLTLFENPRHPYTASLLSAIPRVEDPPHRPLVAIPGRPVDIVDPKPGCRFAPRCARAQAVCVTKDPPLTPVDDSDRGHTAACFFPVGSAEGDVALQRNLASGVTAAGLPVGVAGAIWEAG